MQAPILNLTFTVLTRPSPTAVTVRAYEPTGVPGRVLMRSVEVPGGVSVLGLNVLLEFAGRPFRPKVTGELKPFRDSNVRVNEVDWPGPILCWSGDADNVKPLAETP